MARRPWNADTLPPAAPSAAPNRQHRVTFLEPIFWIVVAVGTTITGRPPAQIRTGAFTHTALTVEEWRRNALLAAHRAIPGTCASRSVSDACVINDVLLSLCPSLSSLRRRQA